MPLIVVVLWGLPFNGLMFLNMRAGRSLKGLFARWLRRRYSDYAPPLIASALGFALIASALALPLHGPVTPVYVLMGLALAWEIDDWLNGDDRWKRRWRTARNKIKWRMQLPAPRRSVTGSA